MQRCTCGSAGDVGFAADTTLPALPWMLCDVGFRLSDTTVRKMVRQQPALLSYFPETLEGAMRALCCSCHLSHATRSTQLVRSPEPSR